MFSENENLINLIDTKNLIKIYNRISIIEKNDVIEHKFSISYFNAGKIFVHDIYENVIKCGFPIIKIYTTYYINCNIIKIDAFKTDLYILFCANYTNIKEVECVENLLKNNKWTTNYFSNSNELFILWKK